MMEQTTILDENKKDEQSFVYSYSDKEQEVVSSTFSKFRDTADSRNQGFAYFDGRDLISFIDDNVRRWFTTVDERDGIEDWQARVFDPFTRNKVIAILGKVSSAIPKVEFLPVGDEDTRRTQILGDIFEYTLNIDDDEELMFFALLEAAVKGTVIGYEGYEEKTKKVRDIVKYSETDMQVKETDRKIRRLFGSIIPLEDFYPSSVGIRRIKNMPFCFWRSVMKESEFRFVYGHYEKSQYVKPNYTPGKDEERPFYLDYISTDVGEGEYEVIKYYNQDSDKFVILANGIWLNPIGSEDISPIPFNHKILPFWSAIYEPFGSDFFYGQPLPNKLKSMQDVLNVLHNMMLDQSFLSIFAPVLVGGMEDIEDDVLVPGRRIPVQDVNNFKSLQIGSPNDFHTFILQYTKRVLEESSIDSVQQGIAGSGDRVTATEISQAAQGVTSILGLFIQFIRWGVKDKARLRAKNILQFYTAPMIEQVGGEGASEEYKKAFNIIRIEDSILTTGKRGTKIIEMYNDRQSMPDKVTLRTQAKMLEKETGTRIEKIAINPEYIRNFEFDIKLVANPKVQENKALDRALFMEYGTWAMNLFPDLVNKEELFAEGTEKFGFRADKFMVKQNQPQQPQQMGTANGTQQNIVNGATGGNQSALALRDLMEQQ
jgi:hypothetical protein